VKASVIITSFNRPELLKFGLESFVGRKLAKDYVEFIVLNDGDPNDGTKEICDSFSELNIRYFNSQHKTEQKWRIPGFAINYGIKESKGEFVFISCAEMYHLDNTIEIMLDALNKNRNILTIPSLAKDDNGSLLEKKRKGIEIQDYDLTTLEPLHNIHLPFFMGMDKKRIVNIGGYDEDFTGCGWDDNDIADRLLKSGCRYQRVGCRVVHLYHPRLSFHDPATLTQFNHNRSLYNSRKRQIIRNQGREWGQSF
jgi:glycosyltransferase involved in cell wall biosynthesis